MCAHILCGWWEKEGSSEVGEVIYNVLMWCARLGGGDICDQLARLVRQIVVSIFMRKGKYCFYYLQK